MNGINERRFVLQRHGAVRVGGELDLERAVRLGKGGAMRDGLGGGRLPPPAPVRTLHAAFDAPLHFCSADRRAGVGGGLAGKLDGRPSLAASTGALSSTWNFGRLYSPR